MPSARSISIPDGFVAVPLSDGPAAGSLRMAVIVRRTPDGVGGRLITLPAPTHGRAMLGVLLDPDDRPTEWLRLEFEDATADAVTVGGAVETNRRRAERWAADSMALLEVGAGASLCTGWETESPAPTVLDPETWRLRPAVDPGTGHPLTLCTDDARLAAAGRGEWSGSLHRTLVAPASGGDADAPSFHDVTPEIGADRAAVVPAGCEPFDLECRRRRASRLDGVELDAALEVLAGREPGSRLRHGRDVIALGLAVDTPVDEADHPIVGDGWLFHGSFGRRARVVESLHLRVRLWADIVEDAAELVRRLGRPLLDIRPERITVTVADDGPGLPRLWTLRAQLATAGTTAVMSLPGSDERRFVRAVDTGPSIYESGSASRGIAGRAAVRIREVLDDDGGTVVIGTIESSERLPAGRTDLVRLDLPLRDGTTPLHVRIESDEDAAGDAGDGAPGAGAGPRRWRSIATTLDADRRETLAAAAGIPLDGVRFEAVPAVGSPSDLYALAILGARMLLCDQASELPVAVDDLLAFASRLARTHDADTPIEERIDFLLRSDPRLGERLGPGRLRPDETGADELIPAAVWHQVLGTLVRLVPGAGPDSWCRDAGDMAVSAPHRVFDPAREAVGQLVLRTRSLAVVDWRQNREVAGLLRRLRSGLAASRGG